MHGAAFRKLKKWHCVVLSWWIQHSKNYTYLCYPKSLKSQRWSSSGIFRLEHDRTSGLGRSGKCGFVWRGFFGDGIGVSTKLGLQIWLDNSVAFKNNPELNKINTHRLALSSLHVASRWSSSSTVTESQQTPITISIHHFLFISLTRWEFEIVTLRIVKKSGLKHSLKSMMLLLSGWQTYLP